ncbi:MAG: 2-C-methyl-D-erythritol 4-phosphate cytidylyltransferase [Puniceicoccales bacterium]|jgi:2-C-methyl-D-erythritol 4-phosphate cytidylyltransferase|nr:2-C-methyl-D-erythritol 4-phosphate cytidylyltransferase [Puniceicoccales bacterium]
MQRYAIILIAGQSQRFGKEDKCLTRVRGYPVAFYSFETFRRTDVFCHYFFVHRDDFQKQILENFFQDYYSSEILSQITWVLGGKERMFSVHGALQVIHKQFSGEAFVFIHDGARPMITDENIHDLNVSLSVERGAVLAHRAIDTIMAVDMAENIDEKDITVRNRRRYLERTKLWIIETPQAFYFPQLFKNYCTALWGKRRFTDDSSIFSGTIKLVENRGLNLKITYPEDINLFEKICS